MAITEAYVDTGTSISTTEYSLTADSTTLGAITTDGIYQVFLDLNAMAAGDEYRLRVYEKTYGAATQRVVYECTIVGVQAQPIFVTPSLILMHGWEVTLKKIAGTDRSIAWSIRSVA